jgi:hypothetical protein
MSTQAVITHLRGQFGFAHNWLEGTLGDTTAKQAHWQPAGRAQPIVAEYLHKGIPRRKRQIRSDQVSWFSLKRNCYA